MALAKDTVMHELKVGYALILLMISHSGRY